jgi:cytochrome c biogenesis protein
MHGLITQFKEQFNKAYLFFTNIWLAVAILLVIILFLAIGSFLPMDLSDVAEGNVFYQILITLGFKEFFTSPMFSVLLILLLLNLSACTVKRILKLPNTPYWIGTHIGHIGLIVVLLGGIITQMFGWKMEEFFFMNELKWIPKAGFSVKAYDFQIEHYPDGTVKTYIGDIAVVDNNQEVKRKVIKVNEPLIYKNVYMYQAYYGNAWDHFTTANFQIIDRKSRRVLAEVKNLEFNVNRNIPALGLTVLADAFYADFRFDRATRKAWTETAQHNNPAIHFKFSKNGKLFTEQYAMTKFPQINMSQSPYDIVVTGYDAPRFTGLIIKWDPGMKVVWAGFLILIVGLTMSCYFPRGSYQTQSAYK